MILQLGNFIDELIDELQADTITTVFGPPGCGKTTLCFQYANECLKHKKKVIYIDTEGGFSVERLKQINPDIDFSQIVVFTPKTFEKQHEAIESLCKQIKNDKHIGLVIVDSLVMLYRLKLGDAPQRINTELGEQLRMLTEISRTFHIPVLVTNQMYQDFDSRERKMVGGSLIAYWSKTILELDISQNIKKAILKKHKFKREGTEIIFEIEEKGLVKVKGSRSFNFFK